MTTNRKAIISLSITDRGALQAAYMPFVEGGGIFVPTTQQYSLGDEVFLLVGLMEESERYPVPGKVCWITASGNNETAGIGVQFTGEKAASIVRVMEDTLGGLVNSERATHTM